MLTIGLASFWGLCPTRRCSSRRGRRRSGDADATENVNSKEFAGWEPDVSTFKSSLTLKQDVIRCVLRHLIGIITIKMLMVLTRSSF